MRDALAAGAYKLLFSCVCTQAGILNRSVNQATTHNLFYGS